MKRLLGTINTRMLLLTAFALLCFGVLVVSVGRPTRPQNVAVESVSPNEIKIINKTTTLEGTLQTAGDNNLLLKVKNLSSKDMNGYVIAFGRGQLTVDISVGDRVISTDDTDEMKIPILSSSMTLTILGAMFSDGSIEAEPALKKELSEWRLGLKKELVRNLAVLNEILKSPDVYSTKALERLDDSFSLPTNSDALSNSERGVHGARENLNSELKSIKAIQEHDGSAMQIQQLLDLRGRLERRIARL